LLSLINIGNGANDGNEMNQNLQSTTYAETRQAWRDIWIGTEFDNELKALEYRRAQEVLQTYLPFLDRKLPVLEAGCGPAHVVYYLQQHGYRAVGVDYAPEALVTTHERFPTLPLHMGDVHNLPYASNTFGGVLSFGVVEHFEHGPDQALRESYRVLARNGKLVITVPHPQFVESLYILKQKLFPNKTARAGYYERTYNHDELANQVRDSGFKIELVKPVGHSYTYYGLGGIFRNPKAYYDTSALAEKVGDLSRRVMPWLSAFHTLIIASK
jgi:SAM-dependent methyltransferase